MINKIVAETPCKTCNCSSYNSSDSCNVTPEKNNTLKSPIFIKEQNRLQAPVIVSYFKQKRVTFQNLTKRSRWRSRRPKYEGTAERFNICRWYKKKRALNSLRNDKKKELDKERRINREDYERERVNDIIHWEYGKQQKAIKEEEKRQKRIERENARLYDALCQSRAKEQKQVIRYEPRFRVAEDLKKEFTADVTKTKPKPKPRSWPHLTQKNFWAHLKKKKKYPVEKKKIYIKEKSVTVKPPAQTKKIYVKRHKPKYSLTSRFVNCCYRICCQFYCCLTCILLIAFVIFFIL